MARPAVSPSPEASASGYRPLPAGAVELVGGEWHRRQRVNARASLAHGLEQLQRSGTIANFETLAADVPGAHGHLGASDGDVKNFVDSDVYKWLEAVAWATVGQDVEAALLDEASRIIDVVGAAQAEDGYLNTWFQRVGSEARFSDLAYGHELYCLGHLIQAGLAWSRARDDGRLLAIARRFADLVIDAFAPTRWVCGHPCVEMAMVELSRQTSVQKYARFAAELIDRRGAGVLGAGRFGAAYYQDDRPYRQMTTLSGHAVRAVYLASGAVDVAVESDDAALLDAARTQWRNVVATRTYITGGIGSRYWDESFGDDFELPSDGAYCETCAAIGLVMWTWRLSLTDLDGDYGDLVERAIYNALLSGIAPNGRSFHYTNPLEVRGSHPRHDWFEIACCPPNAMRMVASLDQLVATETDDGVQLHHFTPARIDAGRGREVTVSTAYPAYGDIAVEVRASPSTVWGMSLRIPVWAAGGWTLHVNGEPVDIALDRGYATVTRAWNQGDVVTLRLDMKVRQTTADARIGVGSAVVIERGPIVYCLDEARAGVGDIGVAWLVPHAPPELEPNADGVAPLIAVQVAADEEARNGWPYSSSARSWTGGPRRALLVPFAEAGLIGAGKLRTWIPRL